MPKRGIQSSRNQEQAITRDPGMRIPQHVGHPRTGCFDIQRPLAESPLGKEIVRLA